MELQNQSTKADESGCIHYKTEMKSSATLSLLTNTVSIGSLSPISPLKDTHVDH